MGLAMDKNRNETGSPKIVADLDSIVADPVAFKFNGQTHLIRPVTTKEFYVFLNSYQRIIDTLHDDHATRESVVDAAHGVISSVCSSITLDHVMEMTQPQVTALIRLIIQVVSGKDLEDVEKKKIITATA